ncbi:MAG: hypothetical protein ABJC55_18600, partial [Algoriphagus sp.]
SHICMGEEMLVKFGIATKHLNCGMKMDTSDDASESSKGIDPLECCQDQFEFFHQETERNLKNLSVDAPQLIFIAAFTQVFIFGVETLPAAYASSPSPSPPLIPQDYTVLYQSFLI